jgi:hypothetical protein
MNVYRSAMDSEGVVKLRTRQGPSFIFLKPIYSNNKDWEKQVSRVSGEWECPKSMKIAESQRISWEWRALDGNLVNPPEISDAEQEEVTRMIDFCNRHHKVENDFDVIVTVKSLNDHLGYKIPENKVPLTRAGKPKFMKSKASTTPIPPTAQRGKSQTRKPPSRATSVEGVRAAPRVASPSRERRTREAPQTLGHDTAIATDSRAVVVPEDPLFREAGGVVIEMGIPDCPPAARADSAGGSNEVSREEVSDVEVQRDVTPPEVPGQSCYPEVRQTSLPDSTRLRKGVGTKRKADGLQKGRASKRPYVEEGDDFLLNEISLAAQNFGLPEFTWRGEPLSPLSSTGGTRVGSEPSREPPPAPEAHMCKEETTKVIFLGTRAENSASGAEGGSQGEELG